MSITRKLALVPETLAEVFTLPPPRSDLKWLAVDLDGTLAEPVWTPESPGPEVGDPIEKNVAKVRAAVGRGYKIIIHTSRSWTDYEFVESWLIFHEIPWHRIVCGKLLAAAYIDDRAVHESADSWGKHAVHCTTCRCGG